MTTSSASACALSALLSALATATLFHYWWHASEVKVIETAWKERAKEERTGRVRAEVKLRELRKKRDSEESTARASDHVSSFAMRSIGTVTSPFMKRMGTPRQPQVAPSSRGYIQFSKSIQPEALSGIEEYGHVWVIFEFHANTDAHVEHKRVKIRPPRAGGAKVGQLATRSPHRPNPVGQSLVQVHRWDRKLKRLHVRGIDIVHGTPVYDIKPFVPWDMPSGVLDDGAQRLLRVPEWVNQKDEISSVSFSSVVKAKLKLLIEDEALSPLYNKHNDGVEGAMSTLREVLMQDPRSSHRGKNSNARGSVDSQTPYSIMFGGCQVDFVVSNSGITVVSIKSIPLELATYADGIPLFMR